MIRKWDHLSLMYRLKAYLRGIYWMIYLRVHGTEPASAGSEYVVDRLSNIQFNLRVGRKVLEAWVKANSFDPDWRLEIAPYFTAGWANFGGRLPRQPGGRKGMVAAQIQYGPKKILLFKPRYRDSDNSENWGSLIHEMAHIKVKSHNPITFMVEMHRVSCFITNELVDSGALK